jgi:hypothetical protein
LFDGVVVLAFQLLTAGGLFMVFLHARTERLAKRVKRDSKFIAARLWDWVRHLRDNLPPIRNSR